MIRCHKVALIFALGIGVSCQPPSSASDPSQANADGLPGVDTSALTRSERDVFSELVTEQLAPCREVPKSLAECLRTAAPCSACRPAAELLAKQVQRGKSKAMAERIYHARFDESKKVNIDIAGAPSRGPESAPITIVEWADFECAYCGRGVPLFAEQEQRLKGKIRFIFRHFPLKAHPKAEALARFAVAAQNQKKFWEAYELLFSGAGSEMSDNQVRMLAGKLGIDAEKVISDMKSPTTEDRLKRDRDEADRLGLKGTPFVFVNGRHFDFELFDLEEDLPGYLDTELESLTRSATP